MAQFILGVMVFLIVYCLVAGEGALQTTRTWGNVLWVLCGIFLIILLVLMSVAKTAAL